MFNTFLKSLLPPLKKRYLSYQSLTFFFNKGLIKYEFLIHILLKKDSKFCSRNCYNILNIFVKIH